MLKSLNLTIYNLTTKSTGDKSNRIRIANKETYTLLLYQ